LVRAPALAHSGAGALPNGMLSTPLGPVEPICEWPEAGVAETRVAIDAGPILAAAQEAITLWDSPGGAGTGGIRVNRT
jgi:hypothetical protein